MIEFIAGIILTAASLLCILGLLLWKKKKIYVGDPIYLGSDGNFTNELARAVNDTTRIIGVALNENTVLLDGNIVCRWKR